MDSNLHDQSNTVNLQVELQGKWNQMLPEWSTYTTTNEYYAVLLLSSYIRRRTLLLKVFRISYVLYQNHRQMQGSHFYDLFLDMISSTQRRRSPKTYASWDIFPQKNESRYSPWAFIYRNNTSVLVNINERATEKLYDGISIRNMCWLQLHIVAVHFLSYTDTKLKPLFIHCF